MKNLRAKLPPPGTLVVFEAAGRLLNFTQAGIELGMSQAAVSKQMRSLEERLGVTLFRRANHRALALTQSGRKLHRAVTMGFDHIIDAINEVRPRPRHEEVSVTTTIALASVWLMPRIAKFRAAHPGIDLRVIAADPISDLAAETIDLGIRYGMGQWPGTRAERLFGIELFPVCSPDYLNGCRSLRSPSDLLKHTLLHIDEPNSQDADWAVWLKAVGAPRRPFSGGLRFNNYPLLIQAAVNGQGIALGWGHLIDDFLDSGMLVRALPTTLWLKPAFYIASPIDVPVRKEVEIFRDWIIESTHPLRDGQ